MKIGLRWRLACFALAMLAVALAIGWTGRLTWKEVHRLSQHISTAQIESFEIADYFQATILELNQVLRNFYTRQELAAWNKFVQESEALDRWIDDQRPRLPNPDEQRILDQINAAYDAYRAEARQLTNAPTAASPDAPAALLQRMEGQSRNLFHLGNNLAAAHRESVSALLAKAQHSFEVIQQVVFGLLFVLLALGGWVAVVVYRDMIAPLHVTLVETRAVLERQEKLASLGVLAAGVAHEIRNPLTAIKARLFTQQKRLTPGSPEAADAIIISNEIHRLERIVRDVLQFARPAEPSLIRTSLEALLGEVRDLLVPQLDKAGIHVSCDVAPKLAVEMDLPQIKQVLINLVQNAADSIDRNGVITLRARQGTGRLHGSMRSAVVIEVEDTGKGMTAEVQKRLFDPFFSTKEGGTGLGLAIAARIVGKHGGRLEFRTLLNRGTVFSIVLPNTSDHENTR